MNRRGTSFINNNDLSSKNIYAIAFANNAERGDMFQLVCMERYIQYKDTETCSYDEFYRSIKARIAKELGWGPQKPAQNIYLSEPQLRQALRIINDMYPVGRQYGRCEDDLDSSNVKILCKECQDKLMSGQVTNWYWDRGWTRSIK